MAFCCTLKLKLYYRIRSEAVKNNKTILYTKKYGVVLVMGEKKTKYLFCSNLQMH
jgi:hypothetical protein